MSLVAVACGRGSRGVTTTALALAATWPVPAMIAECDPAGGSLAARFGLEPVTGTLSLASTSRHGLSAEEVGAHVRRLPIGLPALIGPPKAEQAEGIARFWPTVAPVLARLGTDVIADCGRLTARPPTAELLRAADLCVIVAEPSLDGLEQAKDRALAVSGWLREPPVMLLLGDGPYNPAEVSAWLAEGRVDVTLIGTLATDDRGAMLINGVAGRAKALSRSTLMRSARALSAQLHARVASARPAEPRDRHAGAGQPLPEAGHGQPGHGEPDHRADQRASRHGASHEGFQGQRERDPSGPVAAPSRASRSIGPGASGATQGQLPGRGDGRQGHGGRGEQPSTAQPGVQQPHHGHGQHPTASANSTNSNSNSRGYR